MKKSIKVLIVSILLILSQFTTALAADLIQPVEFGPGFFINLPGITTNDITINELGFIVAVSDEALIREGISVESVGIFKLENNSNAGQVMDASIISSSIKSPDPVNRWNIVLSDYDRHIIAKIVDLEAGNQPDEGQQAVVEVIFNRVYSGIFPNTVIEVLSQRRQFTTWSFVEKGNPDSRVYQNIDIVLNGQSNILPYETLYFSTKPFRRKPIQAKIYDHYFCNQ